MLRPPEDFLGTFALNNAMVNFRIPPFISHEVCEVSSALHSWVPDDVFGTPVGSYRRDCFPTYCVGTTFWHSEDFTHSLLPLIAIRQMSDRE